ncbi:MULTISPECIES: SP_0009 family protein [Streptococcus]|uniref:Recombinase n=1 Tax=Streptococcus zalophi TaxID=640031 RepID=A0A934UDV1_9STRE|nr:MULTISPECIES: SP_0009 family protein [Streptococcus]MBJ8350055.1 recombinase [Streptococcus zalophi]MCR8968169.1 SP_0009 family protein [Streptococcus zalophi]MCU9533866.1 SP_0009 family protein [Streptococcus sp. CSL10205-OR2]
MKNLINTIEKFLTYSDDKLKELSEKNQQLKEKTKKGEDKTK